MKKYQVIGGQYEFNWIGESDSLHSAKIIAKKNVEFWDNMIGFHVPDIYLSDDVKEVPSELFFTRRNSSISRVPIDGKYTVPYAYYSHDKWIITQ